MKQKAQNNQDQRSNKRFQGNNQDRQWNEFLQWKQMRNQCVSSNNNNNNYNNFQASCSPTQRTMNNQFRNTTPAQTRQQTCQHSQPRSQSSH